MLSCDTRILSAKVGIHLNIKYMDKQRVGKEEVLCVYKQLLVLGSVVKIAIYIVKITILRSFMQKMGWIGGWIGFSSDRSDPTI